jgi:hypothetical protein
MRDRITITVAYRGGAEAWFEVSARGKRVFRPGGIALIDLMREICNERGAGSQVNT